MKRFFAVTAAVIITVAALLALIYFYHVNPGDNGPGIACMTYTVFGLYCAGCGLTRQLHHLLHGEFAVAFSYNPMGIIIWPVFLVMYVVFIRWVVFKKPLPKLPLWVVIVFTILLIIYMILRNIPYEPFCYLAPPK